ncbi:hypothetical protein [Streptomyces sp. NPDC055140]
MTNAPRRGPGRQTQSWRAPVLGLFDRASSNPPFGAVARSCDTSTHRPRKFEYHAITAAARVAKRGIFIVPRASIYDSHPWQRTTDCLRFTHETGIELATTWMHVDAFRDQWGDPTPQVSVAYADFRAPSQSARQHPA